MRDHYEFLFRRPELQERIRVHSVPFYFMRYPVRFRDAAKFKIAITGGSAFLWRTIEGHFIVTACHVWREFEELMRNCPGGCYFFDKNGPVLIHEPTLVSADENIDIAVLTAPNLAAIQLAGKSFYLSTNWPLAPLESGDTLAFFGFPKTVRRIVGKRVHVNSIFLELPCSVSASGRLVRMDSSPDIQLGVHISARIPRDLNLGGISGAPVFCERDGRIDWVGIVRSGVYTNNASDIVVQVAPSRFVMSNGIITPDNAAL